MNDRAFGLTTRRSVEESATGNAPGATSSMFKYYGLNKTSASYDLMLSVMGTQSVGWSGDGFEEEELNTTRAWLRSKANSIEGGTSEVQLNIIAKRVLGLLNKIEDARSVTCGLPVGRTTVVLPKRAVVEELCEVDLRRPIESTSDRAHPPDFDTAPFIEIMIPFVCRFADISSSSILMPPRPRQAFQAGTSSLLALPPALHGRLNKNNGLAMNPEHTIRRRRGFTG